MDFLIADSHPSVGFPPPDLIASCYSAGRDYQRRDYNLEDSIKAKTDDESVPTYITAGDFSDRDSWVVVHDWFSLPKVREVENSLITLQCSKDSSIIASTLDAMMDFFLDGTSI